jgi:hypothetical protein
MFIFQVVLKLCIVIKFSKETNTLNVKVPIRNIIILIIDVLYYLCILCNY